MQSRGAGEASNSEFCLFNPPAAVEQSSPSGLHDSFLFQYLGLYSTPSRAPGGSPPLSVLHVTIPAAALEQDKLNAGEWQVSVRAQEGCKAVFDFSFTHLRSSDLLWKGAHLLSFCSPLQFGIAPFSHRDWKTYHAIISTQIWIKAHLRMLFKKVRIKF